MGKYTVLDDPAADAAVQSVLDRVCKEVSALLGDNLQAIVLVGGYGRGEGGIYKTGDNYNLVNDLDILVFVNRGLKKAKKAFGDSLKQLSVQLLEIGRGLKAIDIELTHINRYKFFIPKTVGFYEVACGNQVIHGDVDLRKVMPDIDPTKLSLFEGTNYFRNRGSGLLIPALYFLTGGLNDPAKRKNFQIELHKACQAMGDAFLLRYGQYHFSYRERLARFNRLKQNNPQGISPELLERVASLYEWGMSKKLSPTFDWPEDKQMIDKWFEVQRVFDDFFILYESNRLNHRFTGWNDYAQHVEHHGAGEPLDLKLRAVLWSIHSHSRKGKSKSNSLSPLHRSRECLKIMPLLVFSLAPDRSIKPSLVETAARLFELSSLKTDLALWKELVKRYLLIFYAKDVVLDALSPLAED